MDKFKLIFWNEFKRIFCYHTRLRKIIEKKTTCWKKYSILTDIKIEEMKKMLKDNNTKVLILDMDGTLKHYKNGLLQCNKKWVEEIKKYVKVYVISNANKKLTSEVADKINVNYINNAKKPSPKGFIKILNKEKITGEEAIVIGDAIVGDIIGSRRAGINKSILLDDMNININNVEINFK